MNIFKKLFSISTQEKKELNAELQKKPYSSIWNTEQSFIEKLDFIKGISQDELVKVIDEMFYDDDILTNFENLKASVLDIPYTLNFDEKTPEETRQFFQTLTDKHIKSLLSLFMLSVAYGFRVISPVWKTKDSKIIPAKFNDLGTSYFRFNSSWQLYCNQDIISQNQVVYPQQKILDNPFRFWAFSHDVKEQNLYGNSLIMACYYLFLFKNTSLQEWELFAKKVAIPSFFALFQATEDETETQTIANNLSASLRAIRSGTGGALANVDKIEKLEANASGWQNYEAFLDVAGKKIAKIITGSFLTSDTAKNGSYTTSEIHNETAKRKALSIAQEFSEYFNNLFLKQITELNFPNITAPTITFYTRQKAEFQNIAKLLELGFAMQKDKLLTDYNIPLASEKEAPENIVVKAQNFEQEDSDSFFLPKTAEKFKTMLKKR